MYVARMQVKLYDRTEEQQLETLQATLMRTNRATNNDGQDNVAEKLTRSKDIKKSSNWLSHTACLKCLKF